MDALQKLKEFVLQQTSIIDEPGKLLYSSAKTLRPYPIYFLGTKPGGTLPTTIRQSLDDLETDKNEYLDYSWEKRPPGEAKLQKQVRRYLGGLGFDVRDVPASNIVFTRAKSTGEHPDLDGHAKLSWLIHLRILEIVKPDNILVFGSGQDMSPFSYLKEFLCPKDIEARDAGQKPFTCYRFKTAINNKETGVIAVPHLTRYSPYKHPEIMEWVKEWL